MKVHQFIDSLAKFQGLEVIKEYIADGFSGGNFDRLSFKEMIKDIEDGVINCVKKIYLV